MCCLKGNQQHGASHQCSGKSYSSSASNIVFGLMSMRTLKAMIDSARAYKCSFLGMIACDSTLWYRDTVENRETVANIEQKHDDSCLSWFHNFSTECLSPKPHSKWCSFGWLCANAPIFHNSCLKLCPLSTYVSTISCVPLYRYLSLENLQFLAKEMPHSRCTLCEQPSQFVIQDYILVVK